ncbi:hypothetical protein FEM21_28690 [Flavobacterium seoulense]|uniref:Uncharacterized protein n=1 Tax=Flavobacterium seoulense TaxID=1492738 RepID=A0A066WJ56_9FLAO|nr:hypothetical protein FEM21_28690 [Flavobacterium seoulense]
MPPISECAAAVSCNKLHNSVYFKLPEGKHWVKLISKSLHKMEVKLGSIGMD